MLVRATRANRSLIRSPLIIGFTTANALLAVAHLVPPSAETFQRARLFLAVSRSFQGLPEFLSFSLLVTSGLLSPIAMFSSIMVFAGLLALIARAFSRAGDELKEILPALVLISLAFGVLSGHAGDLLVSAPVSCTREASPLVSQKVVTYYERGWDPGAVYFLLVPHAPNGTWRQLRWTRVDLPITNPCDVISDLFPADR